MSKRATAEGGGEGEQAAPKRALTKAEAAVYDRQLRVWGVEAQQRCASGGAHDCMLLQPRSVLRAHPRACPSTQHDGVEGAGRRPRRCVLRDLQEPYPRRSRPGHSDGPPAGIPAPASPPPLVAALGHTSYPHLAAHRHARQATPQDLSSNYFIAADSVGTNVRLRLSRATHIVLPSLSHRGCVSRGAARR